MVGAFFLSLANLEGEVEMGIITNVFLGLVKAFVGVLAGFIALATDALNNLSMRYRRSLPS